MNGCRVRSSRNSASMWRCAVMVPPISSVERAEMRENAVSQTGGDIPALEEPDQRHARQALPEPESQGAVVSGLQGESPERIAAHGVEPRGDQHQRRRPALGGGDDGAPQVVYVERCRL